MKELTMTTAEKVIQGLLRLVLSVTFLATSLSAQIIAYDSFDYLVGNLSGSNGGTGWSTQWNGNTAGDPAQIVTRSLRYANGDVSVDNDASGKALQTRNTTTSNHAYRRIYIAPEVDEIFVSALFQVDTPDDSWFTQLWLWATVIGGLETFPSMSQYGNGVLHARIGGSGHAASGVNTRDGEVNFLVIRLSKTGDAGANFNRLDLYVNPDSRTLPLVSDANRVIDTGKDFVDFLGFRASASGGSTNANLYWGELRVAESWDAAVIQVTPEP